MTKTITISTKTIRNLTTPQLLKGGLYLTWGASVLLAIATIGGVQSQRHAIKTVGKDSVPSIVTAQRLKDALAGMDANAVNELLVKPGENPSAVKDYQERREQMSERLVAAAENITYGDAERKPIQTMQLAVGEYIAKLQQARDANARGDTNGVLVAYREAAKIMDNTLLPAADALDKANLSELENTYDAARFASRRSLFFVAISSLLLIGILVAIQLFLNRRMRRTLNPMLLGATAIAIIFLGYTTRAFLSASSNLKVAKEDAFASMHSLRNMRALGYIINADESRYLLDKAFAPDRERAFFDKAAQIARVREGLTFEKVVAELEGDKNKKVKDLLTGHIADELENITFPGERNAALETLKTFSVYFNIDKQIRQLEQSGRHAEAIALCVGDRAGQSNWAFEKFKLANQKAFDINEAAFNKAVKQGSNDLGFQDVDSKDVGSFAIATPVVAVAIALLTLFGLQPRIKEYF